MPKESRHGLPAKGWTNVGVQLPDGLAKSIRAKCKRRGDAKLMATAGLMFVWSLKEEHRDELMGWLAGQTFTDPERLNAQELLDKILTMASK